MPKRSRTTASDDPRVALDIFLSSPEGGKYLDDVARRVFKAASSINLSPDAVGLSSEQSMPETVMIDEIQSVLVEFLMEKEAVQRAVLCPDAPNPEGFLSTAFIRHWIDRVRRTGDDAFRNLRDYVMRVIREDGRFYRYTRGKEALYSLCERNRTLQPLSDDDLFDIPFPNDRVQDRSLKAIKRITVMPPLAIHFWHSVSEMYGTPRAWVPLNALVRWLLIQTALAEDRPAFGDFKIVGDELSDEATRPDRLYFDPDQVRDFAQEFSLRLKKRQKPSFFLHYCLSMTPREMAETIGYTDETARNHIGEIDGMLRTFLSDLPWVSPPDLNPRAFALFLEILCDILENTVPSA